MSDVAALEVRELHKYFGTHEVLKGIDMTAHKGDVISLIGSSGSGKSTFLRCINLLETPSSGTVSLHGELIRMKSNRAGERLPEDMRQVERIRSRLAMVFQSFNLWSHMTIMQNIIEVPIQVLKVPRAEAIAKAELLLNRVGLWERRDYYPGHLSGGQQQRQQQRGQCHLQGDPGPLQQGGFVSFQIKHMRLHCNALSGIARPNILSNQTHAAPLQLSGPIAPLRETTGPMTTD